ncbi:MAG: hypothetical protein WA988_00670, partial [Candidatus Nanopelagicales bacterium]
MTTNLGMVHPVHVDGHITTVARRFDARFVHRTSPDQEGWRGKAKHWICMKKFAMTLTMLLVGSLVVALFGAAPASAA